VPLSSDPFIAWKVLACGLLLACVVELLTVFARFGLGLESTRDTSAVSSLTFGIRVHHGYFGVLLAAAALSWPWGRPGIRNLMLMLGAALVASDLVHHFLVLWPITGSPQFDLFYPGPTKDT
jgi:hypothetical protein